MSNKRRPEIANEEIVAEGLRQQREGRTVSGWTLRRGLGDRGNPNRLKSVWDTHLAAQLGSEQSPTSDQGPDATLPPRALEVLAAKRTDLSDFLDAFAVQLHREIEDTFTRRYSSDFEALKETQARVEADLRIATESVAATEAGNSALQSELQETERTLTTIQAELAVLTERARNLEGERDAARRDAAQKQDQVASLTQELARTHEARAASDARAQAVAEEMNRTRQDLAQREQREKADTTAAELRERLAVAEDRAHR